MKIMRLGQTRLAIAVTLGLAMAACQGDDTASGGGGSSDSGTDDRGTGGLGTGGQGGTAGQDGAQGGTGGQAGTGGADAAPSDARADVSGDTSVASDVRISDVTDAAVEGEAGTTCVSADGGDAQTHFQLYSFDNAGGGGATADLAAWSTFMMGPIAGSTDDSTPESASPGALHATITYSGYMGVTPVIESYHATPLDFSCFSALHISIKITSSVTYVYFVVLYVTSGAMADGPGYYTSNLLPGIADGNWHELTAPLNSGFTGNKAAVQRIGFKVFPLPMMPDGGPPTPPPVDVFIDNVWLE
jgi:hypothetical protein